LILASILIFSNNLLIASARKVKIIQYGELSITFGNETIINALGNFNILWIFAGLFPLLTSIMFFLRPEKRRIWSIIMISSSLISVFTGGGFIVGVVAIVIFGLVSFYGNTIPHQSASKLEIICLFIMAFIGNEADNMWGSLVFSIPFVYQTIYAIPIDYVRSLFLISPFAYPSIRFLQAIVATVIAVPLLRTLRTAKFIPKSIWIGGEKKNEEI
ncbi:MAG: hypothetical protein QG670_855, partial [Thermoproteota archaeon]|nr:hypothetical protein [Thermoproteota archaeon]